MGGREDDSGLEAYREQLRKLEADRMKHLRSLTDDTNGPPTSPSGARDSAPRGPFEQFKSFIDDNFGTLVDGFKHFPSNVSELKARMQQEREARREDEREIWRRWTGSEDSPDHIRMQVDRASREEREEVRKATHMLLEEAFRRSEDVPWQKIRDLYRDDERGFGGLDRFATPMLSFGGACYYKQETVDNLPSTARWGWPAPRPRWLSVDWFKRSPYSPIRLEGQQDVTLCGSELRAAFEDLLCAALDKPMVSEEKVGLRPPYGKPQSTYYGPGLDWMLSLQCRGILPPQLPSLYSSAKFGEHWPQNGRAGNEQIGFGVDNGMPERLAKIYNTAWKDIDLLMDEVSIKSGPNTEAQPLPLPRTSWNVPETEEELYEQMLPPLAQIALEEFRENDRQLHESSAREAGHRRAVTVDNLDEVISQLVDEMQSRPIFTRYGRAVQDAVHELAKDTMKATRELSPKERAWLAEKLNNLSELEGFWPGGLVSEVARYRKDGHYDDEDDYDEDDYVNDNEDDDEDEDDLDRLMDRFKYEAQRRVSGNTAATAKNPDAKPHEAHTKRPDVLSQLTTTQTTRLPDGTVTTKVVLKQKFADGREEQRESVHVSHENNTQTQQPKTSADDHRKGAEGRKGKKNGWFWS